MLHAYLDDPVVKFALPKTDFAQLASRFPKAQYGFIQDGAVIDLGGMSVDVIEVPGHTNGSVVFSIQGSDIMFTGDAIGSGQGVWIFNEEGFRQYAAAVPHLIDWIETHGVNQDALRIYGGHYWQRAGLPEMKEGEELGMQYLLDMKQLIDNIGAGTAATEPATIRPGLDTYFRYGTACIVWNAAQAQAFAASL